MLFHGSLTPSEKAEAFEAFRNDISVMVATDSAGEGRNLQFAATVVNYDLPWNPMRIEQRIGRVHRMGQDKEVFVFNFCLRDSVEEYVLRVLHDKINMFELVVGEIDSILEDMDSDADFSETVREMWLDNQEREDLAERYRLRTKARVYLPTVHLRCELIRKRVRKDIVVVYNPFSKCIEPLISAMIPPPFTPLE